MQIITVNRVESARARIASKSLIWFRITTHDQKKINKR